MNLDKFLKYGDRLIKPDDSHLTYSGRIGYNIEGDPEFVFPCTYVSWRFKGTSASVILSSKRYYWDVYAGCMLDGRQLAFKLPEDGTVRLDLGTDLPDCDHEIIFFKRQDACNLLTIHGIVLDEKAELFEAPELPKRRIEVYGDSVSAGEVSEAVAYVARPDPEGHEGYFSNSWFSYSKLTANKLNAELHAIAQGGIALLEGTGWFDGPDFTGLEQTYDKIKYYPDLKNATTWDFKKYTPHVVIVAIGQNDANPEDYMKNAYDSEKADNWRRHYTAFLKTLRSKYPKALIVCTTTILGHDKNWDRAIKAAVDATNDNRIRQFMYSKTGEGTPGHIRLPEAEIMAEELSSFIESFGEEIWE